MHRSVVILAAALTIAGTSSAASAQPWDGAQKWGVGLHLSALGLESEAVADDKFELGGGGLHARYRLNHRWEFEASFTGMEGKNNDGTTRELTNFSLSARFHINPTSNWDVAAIGGIGAGEDNVEFLGAPAEPESKLRMVESASFSHGELHLGVGLERRFGDIGVSAELRAFVMGRDEEALDGPDFAGSDNPTPREEAGGQLRVVASYYF